MYFACPRPLTHGAHSRPAGAYGVSQEDVNSGGPHTPVGPSRCSTPPTPAPRRLPRGTHPPSLSHSSHSCRALKGSRPVSTTTSLSHSSHTCRLLEGTLARPSLDHPSESALPLPPGRTDRPSWWTLRLSRPDPWSAPVLPRSGHSYKSLWGPSTPQPPGFPSQPHHSAPAGRHTYLRGPVLDGGYGGGVAPGTLVPGETGRHGTTGPPRLLSLPVWGTPEVRVWGTTGGWVTRGSMCEGYVAGVSECGWINPRDDSRGGKSLLLQLRILSLQGTVFGRTQPQPPRGRPRCVTAGWVERSRGLDHPPSSPLPLWDGVRGVRPPFLFLFRRPGSVRERWWVGDLVATTGTSTIELTLDSRRRLLRPPS